MNIFYWDRFQLAKNFHKKNGDYFQHYIRSSLYYISISAMSPSPEKGANELSVTE